jgi:hypothetical protein
MNVYLPRQPPRPGGGYDVYWSFAAERQKVYRKRLDGVAGSLTDDQVIASHRFTNAYRASDRVSQYLISNVIYDRDRSWVDTFTRVLMFKIFNRIDTWRHIEREVGEISATTLMTGDIDDAVASRARTSPVYSAAYIMPPPRSSTGAKFRRHLELLRKMVRDGAHRQLARTSTMRAAFDVLANYESIGPFLAYQFLTDLNYSPHLSFSETEFVVAGPGALRGLRKCIVDPGDYDAGDVIRWVMDQQMTAFAERDLDWTDLWGRNLQLVDIQNLFCEVDKYTRVAHPELSELAPGTRIKQRYSPVSAPLSAWFPPKWGLNDSIPIRYHPPVASIEFGQTELFPPEVDAPDRRSEPRGPRDWLSECITEQLSQVAIAPGDRNSCTC